MSFKLLIEAVESDNVDLVKDFFTRSDFPEVIVGNDIVPLIIGKIRSNSMVLTIFNYMRFEILNYFIEKEENVIIHCIKQNKSANIIKSVILLCKHVINYIDKRESIAPLVYCVTNQIDLDIIRYLIVNNADVNSVVESDGCSALHYAIKHNNKDVIFELFNNGADVNICNNLKQFPLHLAFIYKHDIEVVQRIFHSTSCANINGEDNKGLTPLCYALHEGHKKKIYDDKFIFELIDKGATLNSTSSIYVADYICNNFELLKNLTKRGVLDVKSVDSNGNSFLHYVTDVKAMDFLLRNGAFMNINLKTSEGLTPLMKALKRENNVAIIKSFLHYGANPNCLDYYFNYAYRVEIIIENPSHLPGHLLYRRRFQFRENCYDIYVDMLVLYGAALSIKNRFIKDLLNQHLCKCLSLQKNRNINVPHYPILTHIFLNNETVITPDETLSKHAVRLIYFYSSELNKMKDVNIIDDISVYDFCFKYYKKYSINIIESEFVLNNYQKVKTMFPIFKNSIITKIEMNLRIKKRMKLFKLLSNLNLKTVEEQKINNYFVYEEIYDNKELMHSDVVYLDGDCLYEIGKYLSDGEINFLLVASLDK